MPSATPARFTSAMTSIKLITAAFLLLLLSSLHAFTPPHRTAPTTALRASIATATGEADRAFRLGLQLEKSGLCRAASAAFHEASTLYQCFLDFANNDNEGSENRFSHVTTLQQQSNADNNDNDNEEVRAVLAYACIRLAHLSNDAFGDSRAATRLYRLSKKIDVTPSAVAWSGIGNGIEGSVDYLDGGDETVWRETMHRAIDAYRESVALTGGLGGGSRNGEVLFHLAVALEVSCVVALCMHARMHIMFEQLRQLQNTISTESLYLSIHQ